MALVAFRSRGTLTMIVAALLLGVMCSGATNEEVAKAEEESWSEWAKDKISEGLGLRTSQDHPSDAAKDTIIGSGEEMKKKANSAYEGAKEGAGSVKETAKEKAQEAKEKAKEEAEEAREKAQETAENGRRKEGWAQEKAKQGYEAAKHKAGETLESAKETIANKYEEAARPTREKAKDFKEQVILGGSPDDEL